MFKSYLHEIKKILKAIAHEIVNSEYKTRRRFSQSVSCIRNKTRQTSQLMKVNAHNIPAPDCDYEFSSHSVCFKPSGELRSKQVHLSLPEYSASCP